MPTDLFSLLSPTNIILFVIIFTRLSGMITTAPLISTYPIPLQIKVWFMASVSFIIFPILIAKSGFQLPTTIPELMIIMIKEFMIGYITGFIANIIFWSVEIAADIVSMQMGLTAAQALNPTTGATSPVFSQAYTLFVSMIFIGLNAYQWIFSAIYKTFEKFPPGYQITFSGHLTENMIRTTSDIFTIGLGIALPIFSVLVITDVLLGFVAKMMPKMNVFMVAMPVKVYIGLLLFVMLLHPMYSQIALLIEKYVSSIIPIMGG